ncbi:hypothetical protein TYRP_012806 [Tyrophagus putrescentiae]|nr:hypothetical protein TYRP_012806 [Tyrophagus putrescentiae]
MSRLNSNSALLLVVFCAFTFFLVVSANKRHEPTPPPPPPPESFNFNVPGKKYFLSLKNSCSSNPAASQINLLCSAADVPLPKDVILKSVFQSLVLDGAKKTVGVHLREIGTEGLHSSQAKRA